MIAAIQKLSRGWGREDLKEQSKTYPKFGSQVESMDKVVQVLEPDFPDISPIKHVHERQFPQPEEVVQDFLLEKEEPQEFLASLMDEVDVTFQEHGHEVEEILWLQSDFSSVEENFARKARPTSSFPINSEDLKKIGEQAHQRILSIEREMATCKKNEELFESGDTENLHGEFAKDVAKFEKNPKLKELLLKYKDVFGPLPPLGKVANLRRWTLN